MLLICPGTHPSWWCLLLVIKQEAVLELFQKALQYCDPKKLYFALLGIYENPQQPEGPKHDMADQLLKTMTRKYNTSAKVVEHFKANQWQGL